MQMGSEDWPKAGQRDGMAMLAALSYCNFLGYLGLVMAPIWVGAMSDLLESDRLAGLIASAEFAAFGVAALAASVLVPRYRASTLILAGGALAFVGDATCSLVQSAPIVVSARLAVGLGQGLLLSTINALGAGTRAPHRTFALMTFTLTGLGAVTFLVAPFAQGLIGARGIFGLMAAFELAGIVCLAGLGQAVTSQPEPAAVQTAPKRFLLPLFSYCLFSMGQLSLWSYLERIGREWHLSYGAITSVLAAGGIVSLLGPWLADRLGFRGGRFLTLALVATGASVSLFFLPEPALAFAAGDFLFNTLGQFCIVYFLTMFAGLDSGGRVVAASPAFMSVGITLGPLAASFAIAHGSLAVLAIACAFHVAAAALLTLAPPIIGTQPTKMGET